MKKIKLITLACSMFAFLACGAQDKEIQDIKKVITEFSKAGDESNAEKLETYLDDNYRVVMNRLFGSEEVNIMSKSIYLEKIKSKEFGGDDRVLSIDNVLINGSTASAKVIFKGNKMTFISLITLVQDLNGNWKLINDVPIIGK